jgi:hypothetical protein
VSTGSWFGAAQDEIVPKLVSLFEQGSQGGEEGIGDDLGAFGSGVDAVGLNSARDVDKVFINHGHEGGVVPCGEIAKDLVEGIDVIPAVVGRQRDAGKEHADVSVIERGEDSVEVAARLVRRHSAEAVVTAELDDDDGGVKHQDGAQVSGGILGGGAAGAQIRYLVVVAVFIKGPLQGIRIGLVAGEAESGSDAVAIADDQGRVCREQG